MPVLDSTQIRSGLPNSIAFSNANRTILASECTGNILIVRQTGVLSTSRTLTLPAASTVPAGYQITVIDETGSPSWWYKIKVEPNGTNTISGLNRAFDLDKPYQAVRLLCDGSTGWSVINSESVRRGLWIIEEDCLYGGAAIAKGYAISTANGGSAQSVSSSADLNAIGVAQLSTGANTNGRAIILTNSVSITLGNGTLWRSYNRIWLQTAPDATDDFVLVFGFGSDTAAEPANGVYFWGNRTLSANLQAVTASANDRSRVDTGIALTSLVGVWSELGVEVSADGTAARFFINGAEIPSSPITVNIPTLSSRSVGILTQIRKTAGTTSRTLLVDQIHYLYQLNNPR